MTQVLELFGGLLRFESLVVLEIGFVEVGEVDEIEFGLVNSEMNGVVCDRVGSLGPVALLLGRVWVLVLSFEDGAIRDQMRLQIDVLYRVRRHIKRKSLLAPLVVSFFVQESVS